MSTRQIDERVRGVIPATAGRCGCASYALVHKEERVRWDYSDVYSAEVLGREWN
jgi:hypothetical protein